MLLPGSRQTPKPAIWQVFYSRAGVEVIVGLILGPMAESQFRRALQISLGDSLVFFKHPGSAVLLALAFIALVAPLLFKSLRRFKGHDS